MNRVVITGIGWVTPMGHSIEEVWKRLLNGESGIAKTTLFDASTFPTTISAEVKDFRLENHVANIEKHKHGGRNTQFALAACAQAWKMADLDSDTLDLDRVGIYLGSGEGAIDVPVYTSTAISAWDEATHSVGMRQWAQNSHEMMNPIGEIEQEPNMPMAHIAIMTGARGPALNCLTACAASTQAIGEAAQILRRGDADVMIGGGAHSMIHPFGVD